MFKKIFGENKKADDKPMTATPAIKETRQETIKENTRGIKSVGRKLEGVIVSNKMRKTLIVAVSTLKLHSKYKKYFKATKRFKVHSEEDGKYNLGDKVLIQETRPLSKEKRWRVIAKIT